MAGFRTYIPGLRIVLRIAHTYMTRWQDKLSGTLTETQYACLLDSITAVSSCLAALGEGETLP
jgi:hypothetical protein